MCLLQMQIIINYVNSKLFSETRNLTQQSHATNLWDWTNFMGSFMHEAKVFFFFFF